LDGEHLGAIQTNPVQEELVEVGLGALRALVVVVVVASVEEVTQGMRGSRALFPVNPPSHS